MNDVTRTSKELAYRDALARIRQACRSDAMDFEAATHERRQVYDIANITLNAHGDLYASGHEPPAVPTRVRLLKDIYDDGQDHHPPGYVGRKGDTVEVREVRTLSVAHSGVTDSSFVVMAGEYEPAESPPPASEAEPVPPQDPSPEWMRKARAEGRAEFLAILLGESAEDFPHEYMGSHSIGATGDYGTHWETEKLRATFAVDDATYSYIDNINGAWWSQQHEIETLRDELQRAAQPPVPDLNWLNNARLDWAMACECDCGGCATFDKVIRSALTKGENHG